MAPSATLTGGHTDSAPKYAGPNRVNPIARRLPGMLVLPHTLMRDDPAAVGTGRVACAFIDKLGVRV